MALTASDLAWWFNAFRELDELRAKAKKG